MECRQRNCHGIALAYGYCRKHFRMNVICQGCGKGIDGRVFVDALDRVFCEYCCDVRRMCEALEYLGTCECCGQELPVSRLDYILNNIACKDCLF